MLQVLWQDAHFIAVNKPAGLASLGGRGEETSVIDDLAKLIPCRLVHRLDKQTSGVLLLAKDREAQRHACVQFQNRSVEKEYLALVSGSPAQEKGRISAALGPAERSSKYVVIKVGGAPAVTDWEVVRRFRGITLLRCFPRTGRTHQIRVHLKSIGLPLAVDPLYNPTRHGREEGIFLSDFKRGYRKKEMERPLIGRLTLHALRLTFHDLHGKPITVICQPPKDFGAAINMLGKYASAGCDA
jgi:RluA family pseudouridine synthase